MDMDQDLMYRIVDDKQVWSGGFLKVDAVELELPNGHRTTHEVVRHPGAAAVVVLDSQNRVLMERQYRTPIDCITREIPAGKLDPGEDPLTCAKRELEEETGYTAKRWDHLGAVAVALGYSDEIIHLYLAQDLAEGSRHLDEDEFLDLEWVPFDELLDQIDQGHITDSKTLVSILKAARLLDI